MRYRAWRSHTNGKLFLLCEEGTFEELPREVRQLGPWAGAREGDVVRLKPQYRALLAEQGFVFDSTARRLSSSRRPLEQLDGCGSHYVSPTIRINSRSQRSSASRL